MGRCFVLSLAVVAVTTSAWAQETVAGGGPWYFAVTGDSRDCGDLIMPKIAQDIAAIRDKTPVEFLWHPSDLQHRYDAVE
ncbi:MAG TPA: hypothetical protein VMT45_04305 [Thermoanaerobaculaceae bacterium]|nr:hypothetical protein [Thermoanaerobaculaceae bacterium]